MRHAVLAALVIVTGAAGPVLGAVTLEAENRAETFVPSGDGGEVLSKIPFSLDARGLVYAKMLVTPWNAVNAGVPNGTVSNGEGVAGWWVAFTLTNASGAAITSDALGRDADPTSGPFVDSTATPAILLPENETFYLEARTHYPASAATPGAHHRVVFAIVFRDPETAGLGGSGGTFEQSRGFTQSIRIPGTPGGTASTGNKTRTNTTVGGTDGGEVLGPSAPFRLPPGVTGTLLVAAVSLAFLALLVSTFAAVLAAWGTMQLLKEVQALRGSPPGAQRPERGPNPAETERDR